MKQDTPLKAAPDFTNFRASVFCCFLVVALSTLVCILFVSSSLMHSLFFIALLFVSFGVLMATFLVEHIAVERWRKNLMGSLPVERRDVFHYRYRKDLESVIDKKMFHKKPFHKNLICLEVDFPETVGSEEKMTSLNWYEIHEVLEANEAPYIEFQFMPESMGYGIYYGMHNPKLFVPKGTDVTWMPYYKPYTL